MAQFVVRNLEEDVHRKLRALAQRHGQSMEEFVRGILRSVALRQSSEAEPLGTRLSKRFASAGLADEEAITELKGQTARSPDLDK